MKINEKSMRVRVSLATFLWQPVNMVFLLHMKFDNTKSNALLNANATPLTVGHGQHVRAWLNDDEYVVLGSGNLAIVSTEKSMLFNGESGLTVEMLDGTRVPPHQNDLGYNCPENTDLDLKVNGRCVVRVRSGL